MVSKWATPEERKAHHFLLQHAFSSELVTKHYEFMDNLSFEARSRLDEPKAKVLEIVKSLEVPEAMSVLMCSLVDYMMNANPDIINRFHHTPQ
jgi:hypothetical protein